MTPTFIWEGEYYWPANKDAVRLCLILSKRRVKILDIETMRMQGHRTMLTNGTEIGRINVRV